MLIRTPLPLGLWTKTYSLWISIPVIGHSVCQTLQRVLEKQGNMIIPRPAFRQPPLFPLLSVNPNLDALIIWTFLPTLKLQCCWGINYACHLLLHTFHEISLLSRLGNEVGLRLWRVIEYLLWGRQRPWGIQRWRRSCAYIEQGSVEVKCPAC